jgi:hypothetical protein
MTAATDTEVGVLPEEASVLFMDTNDVLDNERRTIVLHKCTRLEGIQ